MAIVQEILRDEILNLDPVATEETIAASVTEASTSFGEGWDELASILQHVLVAVAHVGTIPTDIIDAIKAGDHEALAAAASAIEGEAFPPDVKEWVVSRFQLFIESDTDGVTHN